MITDRQIFYEHVGQTSDFPMGLEPEHAEGIYLYDKTGKKYFDLISGVSVSNLGHNNKDICNAVKEQVDKYMHLMVYGEYIQGPQVKLAQKLTGLLPDNLEAVFYVNSGSEAVEAALKLAKRFTGRTEIVSFKNAYHGSTHGALSLMGSDIYSLAYRPLLPDVKHLNYNKKSDLEKITNKTACVIAEVIQAEAGIIEGDISFLADLKQRCIDTGALLIFDEIQTGFGRTGELFAFMHHNIIPDILLVAKAFGGGMPLGGVISSREILSAFKNKPVLGHITTFGGHPVSCAAGLASLNFILDNDLIQSVREKEKVFKDNLSHPKMNGIRGKGLFFAVELGCFDKIQTFIKTALKLGLISDWFLFNDTCFRISAPLIISTDEIIASCKIIDEAIDQI